MTNDEYDAQIRANLQPITAQPETERAEQMAAELDIDTYTRIDYSIGLLETDSRRLSREERHDLALLLRRWRTRAAHLTARLGASEAEALALRHACMHALRSLDLAHDEDRLREHLTAALDLGAGMTLLAQWGAARDLAAWLNDERHWTIGNCPCCGFGRKLDGSEFHGTGCVLDAYNQTVKEAGAASSGGEASEAAPLGTCTRCGAPLDNIAPGFSIVRGGLSVCARCLRSGEEIARAR